MFKHLQCFLCHQKQKKTRILTFSPKPLFTVNLSFLESESNKLNQYVLKTWVFYGLSLSTPSLFINHTTVPLFPVPFLEWVVPSISLSTLWSLLNGLTSSSLGTNVDFITYLQNIQYSVTLMIPMYLLAVFLFTI